MASHSLTLDYPGCADEFQVAFRAADPALSKKALDLWTELSLEIQKAQPNSTDLLRAYFEVSPSFFSERSFSSLENWVFEGLKIAEASQIAAISYFERTPAFIASDNLLHLREWSGTIRQILGIDPAAEKTAMGFISSSISLQQKISYRIYQDWCAAGIRMMHSSPAMADIYFTLLPEGLLRLYQTEMRKIFDLTDQIARELPGKAVAFYQKSARSLLKLNPNVREPVLDVAKKGTKNEAAGILDLFNRVVSGIESLSYPDQETVIRHEAKVAAHSMDAAGVYFDNAAKLLKSGQGLFFRYWVAEGCRRLSQSESAGIRYFAFETTESQEAFERWKNAVFLEEVDQQLSVYARALCGRAIQLKARDIENLDSDCPEPALDLSPEDGADQLRLPAFIADEPDIADNFRIYKVAVAQQAGLIEFGTFGAGYDRIVAAFSGFPFPDLIRDVFFILEHGRVDRCLREAYRGLRADLDLVLERQMSKRKPTGESLLHEALEVLLRLVYNRLSESVLPKRVLPWVTQLRQQISGFYTPDIGISEIFLKAVAVYDLLKPLIPEEIYIPFESLDYLDMSDLELMQEGQGEDIGDELKVGEDADGLGKDLSEEEMARLMEMLKDMTTLEPVKNGEGGKGFVLEGLNARVNGELEELPAGDPKPEEKVVISVGLTKLTTRKGPFFYDEWDYLQKAHRSKWCCLREIEVEPAENGLYEKIYSEYSEMIRDVKRQFQRIRPEELERIRRLEWGSEIDFNAMIQNVVDRKIGDTPSDRIFSRREKKQRSISTFLLIDMSASTNRSAASLMTGTKTQTAPDNGKRIIDIEIESLVVMSEALESLDDNYAIFGFSGYGREQVELFSIKDFNDPYSQEIKNRICGIQPRKSTRMGPAIRHAAGRLRETDSDYQLLIMLSDGYPQDMDYGEDRTSHTYALHDTKMALIEAKRSGIRPFCITIDQCGDDYLKQMIDPGSYLVIKDIYSLPAVLPRVVESLMG